MHKMLVAGAGLAVLAMPAPAGAQETMQEPVQIQANPRGSTDPAVATPNPQTANTPVPPSLPADTSYRGAPYKGALSPPPPEAFNKVYPVCTRTLRDSCRNPGGV